MVKIDESALVIDQFLHLIHKGALRLLGNVPRSVFDQISDLVQFLKKYQCDMALAFVVNVIMSRETKSMPPLVPFIVGAESGRPDLCAAALDWPALCWRKTQEMWWDPQVTDMTSNMLHPAALPRTTLMRLPPHYMWALVQLNLPKDPRGHYKHNDWGSRFMTLVKEEELRRKGEGDDTCALGTGEPNKSPRYLTIGGEP